MSKYYLEGEITITKYVPMITSGRVSVEGNTREELEDKMEAFQGMEPEELAEIALSKDWWDKKHGWWANESEVLDTDDLWTGHANCPPEIDWECIDSVIEEADEEEEE